MNVPSSSELSSSHQQTHQSHPDRRLFCFFLPRWMEKSLSTCALDSSLQLLRNFGPRTSLVVQWLKLGLPMQGVWVRSLVRELRSTCLVAKRPQQKTKEYCNKFNKAFKNGPPKIKLKKKKDCTPSAGVPSAGSSRSLSWSFLQATSISAQTCPSHPPRAPPPLNSHLLIPPFFFHAHTWPPLSQPHACPMPLQPGPAPNALLMPLSQGHP